MDRVAHQPLPTDGPVAGLTKRFSRGGAVWCLAAAAVVLLYLGSVSSHWYPTPDSALYLMLADNLADGNGYTLWGAPHVFVPPGFPLVLAAAQMIGLGHMAALNALMALAGLACLWLSYRCLLEWTDRTTALLATLVVGCSHAMYLASVTQLSDVPFVLLVWGGLACVLQGFRRGGIWLEAGCAALVASCWFRLAGIPLVLGAVAGLLFEARSRQQQRRVAISAGLLLLGTLASAGWMLSYHQQMSATRPLPSYSPGIVAMTGRSMLDWVAAPVRNLVTSGGGLAELLSGQRHSALGAAIGLLWVPVGVGMWRQARAGRWLGVCLVAGYVGLIVVQRPMIARYLLPIAPLLAMYLLEGLRDMVQRIPRLQTSGAKVATALAIVLIAMNVPKDVRLAQALNREDFVSYRPHWAPLGVVAEYLRVHAAPESRFVANRHGSELSYLSGVAALPKGYTSRPSKEDLSHWRRSQVEWIVVRGDRTAEAAGGEVGWSKVDGEPHLSQRMPVFENGQFRVYRVAKTTGVVQEARQNTVDTAEHERDRPVQPSRAVHHPLRRASGSLKAREPKILNQPNADNEVLR